MKSTQLSVDLVVVEEPLCHEVCYHFTDTLRSLATSAIIFGALSKHLGSKTATITDRIFSILIFVMTVIFAGHLLARGARSFDGINIGRKRVIMSRGSHLLHILANVFF